MCETLAVEYTNIKTTTLGVLGSSAMEAGPVRVGSCPIFVLFFSFTSLTLSPPPPPTTRPPVRLGPCGRQSSSGQLVEIGRRSGVIIAKKKKETSSESCSVSRHGSQGAGVGRRQGKEGKGRKEGKEKVCAFRPVHIKTQHFRQLPAGLCCFCRAARVAVSNTSQMPSLVLAEHSK